MRIQNWLRSCVLTLAVAGLLVPQGAVAVEPSQKTTAEARIAIGDLALQPGGVLRGQVVDPQGAPVAASRVALMQQGQLIADTQADHHGQFQLAGLKAGVYQLHTAHGFAICRLWTPGCAPPAARPQALIVSGPEIVRGSLGGGNPLSFLGSPWVLGAIVVTAISVPLAIAKTQGEGS